MVDIHGVQLELLHIDVPSSRAPLVFLHEGLGSVSMWGQRDRYWPRELCVATGRAGWVYSRRGYGSSDPVIDVRGPSRQEGFWHMGRHEPDYMHREAFDVLPELLSHLHLQAPVLVGHSDGGTIALLHASRFPVSACLVMAPHLFVEDIAIRSIEQARIAYLLEEEGRGLKHRLARHHKDVDNAFWQWNDIWLDPSFRTFDIRSECRNIHGPVLAVQGTEDEYGSMEQLHSIQDQVAHAQVLAIPQCGHSPHRDQPSALSENLALFLQKLP